MTTIEPTTPPAIGVIKPPIPTSVIIVRLRRKTASLHPSTSKRHNYRKHLTFCLVSGPGDSASITRLLCKRGVLTTHSSTDFEILSSYEAVQTIINDSSLCLSCSALYISLLPALRTMKNKDGSKMELE